MKKTKILVKSNLLVLLTAVSFLFTGCVQNAAASTSGTKTALKEVTRGDLLIGLTADGTITLPVTPLNFEVSGKISNIYVSAGSTVKKGDVLAELDDSDLQIALQNAQINLSKAESAYQDAVQSAQYNLDTEEKNLLQLQDKYSSLFDDYTYTKSISDAQTTLQRRLKDLEDARQALDDAMADTLTDFDSYTYNQTISTAKTTLQRKQSDLEDAQKALDDAKANYASFLKGTYYDYNIENLKKALERNKQQLQEAKEILENAQKNASDGYYDYTMQAALAAVEQKKQELDEANAVLADALSSNPQLFDSYTYDQSIQSAKTNLNRKKADYDTSAEALEEAKKYAPALLTQYKDAVTDAQEVYDNRNSLYLTARDETSTVAERYNNSVNNQIIYGGTSSEEAVAYYKTLYEKAQEAEASALKELNAAKAALDSAEQIYTAQLTKYNKDYAAYTADLDAAQKTFDSAKTALTDAETSYNNAENEKARAYSKYTTDAETAVENAKKAYNEAQQSLSKNLSDAQSKVDTAQTTVNESQSSLEKAEADLKTSLSNSITDAQSKLKTAQQSAEDAQTSYDKAVTDKLRAQETYISENTDKLDTNITDAQAKYYSAKNSYDDAVTSLSSARENLTRAKASYEEDLKNTQNSIDLSKMKIENMKNSTTSVDNAFYNVEDAKSQLQTAENNLSQIKIIAPIDGTILSVSKKVGELATGSDNAANAIMGAINASTSGIITLCDTSAIYLTTNVAESDINNVSVGQTIRVNVDALDNKELYAAVTAVSSIPTVDSSGITTYEVTGQLNELDSDIKDSMSLFLTFIKKEQKSVLLVPNKAVFVEDGQQYVYVSKNGDETNLEKRAVTCGLSNGTQTEVTDGLSEGEYVSAKGVNLT